jgi:hypothetical protein
MSAILVIRLLLASSPSSSNAAAISMRRARWLKGRVKRHNATMPTSAAANTIPTTKLTLVRYWRSRSPTISRLGTTYTKLRVSPCTVTGTTLTKYSTPRAFARTVVACMLWYTAGPTTRRIGATSSASNRQPIFPAA